MNKYCMTCALIVSEFLEGPFLLIRGEEACDICNEALTTSNAHDMMCATEGS